MEVPCHRRKMPSHTLCSSRSISTLRDCRDCPVCADDHERSHPHPIRYHDDPKHQEQRSRQGEGRRLQTTDFDVVLSKSSVSVAEGGVDAEYTIVLDGEPAATTTVDVSPGSSEITASPASLDFTSGDWSVPQTVTVSAVDDDEV